MFLKKFDIISPQITLYYKGETNHPSIISGVITIISCIIVLIFGIINLVDCLNKKKPTAYFFNRYIEDIGDYYINSTSLFSYIQLFKSYPRVSIDIDFNKVEIIGINVSLQAFVGSNYNLERFDHWIYGKCDDYMNSNESILSNAVLEQSACIKKFYSYKMAKYYDINDANFFWPVIKYGSSNPNTTTYGIIIKKCENTDFRKKHFEDWLSQADIDAYVKSLFISFTIVDNYIDVLNYENPINKFLYSLTSGISSDSYSTNNVNFVPTLIRSYQGLLMNNFIDEISYSFHQNSKSNTLSEKTKILGSFYFWIQNSQQYYERHYQKLTDVFSSIGGSASAVFMIAKLINSFITKFIILLDTQELIFNIKKNNYKYEKIMKRPSLGKFIGEFSLKNVRIPHGGRNPHHHHHHNNNRAKTEANEKKKSNDKIKSGNEIKKENDNFEVSTKRNIFNIENNISNLTIINQNKNVSANIKNISEKKNLKDSKDDKYNNKIKDEEIGWSKFFCYLIQIKKNNPKIQYYEELREQIISEESLFQNYINIINLFKINNFFLKKRIL